VPGFALPGNMAPGLAAAADFQPPALTYTNGAHVVEAEVDSETGGVRLTRYVIVHDCGRMINPMMVEGQVHGAVVHGIGATLLEWMLYEVGSIGQCNTARSLSAAVSKPKVFRGR
jgi:carbon-monoxide dehydrogenase large subunit